ncbi:MAG TPA: S1C family serine protease [Candidatus Paceibacterota bacterium]|nr:S1C family serine protease [Candidatus Paceibacterota bacterium]
MDIEKLTKSQIVLLTLLISFVTSIATGIVTVSLMQQAPPTIAETVNRVIEHTIEAATSTRSQSAAVVEQRTVVVNDAELVAQAVKVIGPSIVKVYTDDTDQPQFLGLGVVIDASGTVAADIGALGDRAEATVTTSDGTSLRSFVTSRDTASGLLYLTPATTTDATLSWDPAPLSKSDPSLGQVVVAIAGENNTQISQGLVTELLPADTGTKAPETIGTDLPASSILPGSVIVDTSGNVVGVSTGISRASSLSGFVPASLLGATKSEN